VFNQIIQQHFLIIQTELPSIGIEWTALLWQLLVIVLGLLLSAVFSGSEVAFFSLSGNDDQLQNNEGEKYFATDQRIKAMLEKPRRLLVTILIGNTFANVITSVMAAVLTGKVVAAMGLSETLVFSIEVLVLTFMIIILSEITPKVIAINNTLNTSRRMSRFIYYCFIVLTPLSKLIAESTNILEKFLPKPSMRITSSDIKTMAEVGELEGSIHMEEREIIENVIEFSNTSVREIMTSRVNIVSISVDNTLDEVIKLIQDKGLSRMPLTGDDLDNIEGIIYAKDVLAYLNSTIEHQTLNWKSIARRALFIPASKKIDDLLRDFQQEKTHIAIVVDEYGGTEGLITLDDILEEIIGDISDEYQDSEQLYSRIKSDTYLFDAKIDLDDMEEILDIQLTTDKDEYETLGGLVYHITERIPSVGEQIRFKNLELTVHTINNNRVSKLKVRVLPNTAHNLAKPETQ